MTTSEERPVLSDAGLAAVVEIWAKTAGSHSIPAVGISMLPLIQEGDSLLVARDAQRLGWGDVIVFHQNGSLVAHRILYSRLVKGSRTFLTKGDNTLTPDPRVDATQVLGRVDRISRGERSIRLDSLRWRLVGWLLAALSLAGLGAYQFARRIKRKLWGDAHSPALDFLQRSFRTLPLKTRKFLLRAMGGRVSG